MQRPTDPKDLAAYFETVTLTVVEGQKVDLSGSVEGMHYIDCEITLGDNTHVKWCRIDFCTVNGETIHKNHDLPLPDVCSSVMYCAIMNRPPPVYYRLHVPPLTLEDLNRL